MVTVANPIYDIVFKYLMNDERIARTILSALLKMDIVHVEMRPVKDHRSLCDNLSICRLYYNIMINDFEGNCKEQTVAILKTRHTYEIIHLFPPIQQSDLVCYFLSQKVDSIEKTISDAPLPTFDNYNGQKSIVIQIPRFDGKICNRHDLILSIFKEGCKCEQQVLHVNEYIYNNDVEVLFILQALQEIASNMEKRLNMNMEDELYFVFRKQYTSLYPN